jgi:hypothetical protein
VVREDVLGRSAPGTAWRATSERAPSAPITQRARTLAVPARPACPMHARLKVHHAHPSSSRVERSKRAACAHGAAGSGALAQPFIELVAVDHADEAAFDRDVDLLVGRRHHARRLRPRHQQRIGDGEVLDQARRDRAAAGLGAAGAVEQQHRMAARASSWPRWRRQGRRRHHHVKSLLSGPMAFTLVRMDMGVADGPGKAPPRTWGGVRRRRGGRSAASTADNEQQASSANTTA